MSIEVVTSVRSSDPMRLSMDASASSKLIPTRICWRKSANSSDMGCRSASATDSNAWDMENPARRAFDMALRASGSCSSSFRTYRAFSHFAYAVFPRRPASMSIFIRMKAAMPPLQIDAVAIMASSIITAGISPDRGSCLGT